MTSAGKGDDSATFFRGTCDLCGAPGQTYLAVTDAPYIVPGSKLDGPPPRVLWIDAYCERCGSNPMLTQGRAVIRVTARQLS